MKRFTRYISVLALLLTITSGGVAQGWLPGVTTDTRFSRQLDALRWNIGGSTLVSGPGYHISFDNQFNSRLYMRDGSATNIQDENTLFFDGRVDVGNNMYTTGYGRSYRYSATDVQQDYMMAGLGYDVPGMMNVEVMGGGLTDFRDDERDQGPSAAIRISTQQLQTGGWQFRPTAWIHYADIDRRTHQNYRGGTHIGYRSEEISLQSRIRLVRSVRERYQPGSFLNRGATDLIEGVTSDTTSARLQVDMPVYGPVRGRININAEWVNRKYENRPQTEEAGPFFDSETTRERLDIRASAGMPLQDHELRAGFEYFISNRRAGLLNPGDFPEQNVNQQRVVLDNASFSQSRFGVFTDNRVVVADGHRLRFNGRATILNYDTPERNVDDRDELTYWLLLGSDNRISDYLSAGVTLAGEMTHQVYLQAERSMDNYRRRSLRLRPNFDWQPLESLQISQNFLLRANYTVYDFETTGSRNNDQSSREFGFQTDIRWTISPEWSIDAHASRSELRIGRLNWDEFTEVPQDTLTTYDFELMVSRKFGRAEVSLGGRYFIKYDYLPQTILRSTITGDDGEELPVDERGPGQQVTRQFGPSVEVDIPFSSGNRLQFQGWLQNRGINRYLYKTVEDPERAAAIRAEEQRTDRRVYPNMELQVRYEF